VNVGVVRNDTLLDDETLRYAIPVIWHVVQTSRGRRARLCRTGAGDGEALRTMLRVAVPPVVAGKVTVPETPPLIGPKVAVTGVAPTTTDAVVVAGRVAAGVGVGVALVRSGGAPCVVAPPQPARPNDSNRIAVATATFVRTAVSLEFGCSPRVMLIRR
jgi:hypothetical protein